MIIREEADREESRSGIKYSFSAKLTEALIAGKNIHFLCFQNSICSGRLQALSVD